MSGENTFTNDLDLGGLEDDFTISMDEIVGSQTTETSTAETDADNNIPSEKQIASERVAEEDDLDEVTLGESSSSSPADDSKLSELYSSLATDFKESGVLPNLDEEIKITSAEELRQAIADEIKRSSGELQSKYKEAMEGGVPKDSFVEYQNMKNQLDAITDEVLSAEDDRAINLRFNIIAQDFINKGHSKEEASKFAKRSVDLGEDLADAKSSLEKLKTFNEAKFEKSKEEAANRVEKEQSDIKKFIESQEEIFKGIKLTKNVRDKLYEQITKTVGSNDNQPLNEYAKAYQEDPVKFQVIQNYLFMMTKGFTDFSKLSSAATKQVSKKIDDVLKSTGSAFFQGGSSQPIKDTETSFNIGDGFDIDA